MVKSKLILLLLFISCANAGINKQKQTPKGEVDEHQAINLAITAWEPVYGQDKINKELPIRATLKYDSIWVVNGTRSLTIDGFTLYNDTIINGKIYSLRGGVLTAIISKKTGQVKAISHSK